MGGGVIVWLSPPSHENVLCHFHELGQMEQPISVIKPGVGLPLVFQVPIQDGTL